MFSNNQLQKNVNIYCQNLAHGFIWTYQKELQEYDIFMSLKKHIVNIGANKPHSGHRFYEALYVELNTYKNLIIKKDIEKL